MSPRLPALVLAVLLIVSAGAAVYLYSSNSQLTSSNGSLSSEVSSQSQTITSLNGRVSNLTVQLAARNGQVSNLTSQVSTDVAQLNSLNGQIASLDANVTSLTSDRATLQSQLSQDEANLTSMSDALKANSVTIASLNGSITSLNSQITSDTTQITSLQSQESSIQSILNLANSTSLVNSQSYMIPAPSGSTCNYEQIVSYKPAYSGYLAISGSQQQSAVYFYLYVTYGEDFAATTVGNGAFSEFFTTGAAIDVAFTPVLTPIYVTLVNCDGHNAASGTITIVSHT